MNILNALTIDVEDYFQVSSFDGVVKWTEWDKYECRVVSNTQRILNILSADNTKATFFILGWVAERFPKLVREIDSLGHEIASHGYMHKLVYRMTQDEFRNDLLKSLKVLEGITGKKVLGYRAASCSITKDSEWAFDILRRCGIKYDASVFPVYHDRYGIPHAERFIHKWNGSDVIEFPFSTVRLLGRNIPVAGGGYFRLYPYWLTRLAVKSINSENQPAMIYVHPWEIDGEQPRIKTDIITGFRHYVNLSENEAKLNRLLDDFMFTTAENILKEQGLLCE